MPRRNRTESATTSPQCLDAGSLDSGELRLLSAVTGKSKAALIAAGNIDLSGPDYARMVRLRKAYRDGEPLAYLLRKWHFWTLHLDVNGDVLIPRADTETLVEVALRRIRNVEAPRIADLGTGSGAIALALADERSDATVVATDNSERALEVARRNAAGASLRVDFRLGNWCEALHDEKFDLIVSNPPYIRADDPHLPTLRAEPRGALVPGPTGLEAFVAILAGASDHLRPGGILALEHGYDQRAALNSMLADAGFQELETAEDLAGQPRVISGRRAV